jgi:hypothetical protein
MQTQSAIRNNQIKAIHTVIHAIGMSDEAYRDMLWDGFKITTSKALDQQQAARLLIHLNTLAGRPGSRFDNLDRGRDMASPRQIRMIEAMWAGVSKAEGASARYHALNKFVKRITGVSDIRFLPRYSVRKIIKAIKTMVGATSRSPLPSNGEGGVAHE